ncbi:hypothetical protein [Natronorubrum halophilum]|nr:hypothetical protein [Natronorubrum halophilum]
MGSATDRFDPSCGALGCTDDADVVIDHPEHEPWTVCDACSVGYEVLWDV